MKQSNSFFYYLKNTLVTILIVLIFCCCFLSVANLAFVCTHTKERVKGYSMLPTLNSTVESSDIAGDTIYANPHAEIALNDIVVASPSWHDQLIIKRLVGLPGNKIQIIDIGETYELYVNDNLLYSRNKYLEDGTIDYYGTFLYYQNYISFLSNENFSSIVKKPENAEPYIELGDDEYFLMGDNWGYTLDSLRMGPVSRKEIVSKTCLIIEYGKNITWETTQYILKQRFSFSN